MVYIFLGAVIHEPLLLDYESALECRVKLGFSLLALAIISVLTSGGTVVDAQSLKIDPLTLE